MEDLGPTALADALTAGGTPSWLVTWWQGKGGIGPATMTSGPFHSHWFMKWLGTAAPTSFVFGKVSSIDLPALGAPTPKVLTYVPTGTATGSVNGNEVTISVPLASLGGLTAGDKIDHISAISLSEHVDPAVNDWVDQAKTFSYVVGTPPAGQHLSDGYVEVSLDPEFTTITLATLNPANNTWTAEIPEASASGCAYARQVLAKDLYTSVWDDVQAGPVAQLCYGSADLAITKTDNRTTAAPTGRNLTYTVTVTNNGPDPAADVVVTDTLPPNVTFVDAIIGDPLPEGYCDPPSGGIVTCYLGTIASGNSRPVIIRVKPTQVGEITNTASVTSATTDPNLNNNTASETTSVCRITSRRTSIPCNP
jgi:uncharacterized repeat protein (TIGR01451 family)